LITATPPRSVLVQGSRFSAGSVAVSGYKHALVSVLAATVAGRGRTRLLNVPDIQEAAVLAAILTKLGAAVERDGTEMRLDCTGLAGSEVAADLGEEIHGSLYMIPALIAAQGQVRLFRAGGCRIGEPGLGGERPVHHMLDVLVRFGASFSDDRGWITGKAVRLAGVDLDAMDYSDRRDVLTGPLVSGATKTAIIAALGAEGATRVRNPYPKCDVTELVSYLAAAGHSITSAPDAIAVAPVPRNTAAEPVAYTLISDISEVMTYIALSVATRVPIRIGNVTVDRVRSALAPELTLLERMAVQIVWENDALHVSPPSRVRSLDIEVTSVGIYSDHQPFFALMLLNGDRPARIREHVWKHRFDYASELRKLGADIQLGASEIVIAPSQLRPTDTPLVARDLRAAAAIVIGAVAAGGGCKIEGVHHLARGYADFFGPLRELGLDVCSLQDL